MNIIKIGISYEGTKDIRPIKIILDKIFAEFKCKPKIIYDIPAGTGIIAFVKSHTKRFFKLSNPVQIAIYLTDKDKQKGKLEEKILAKINEIDKDLNSISAIGIPNPHFEKWLMSDKGNIKSVFRIENKEKIPFSDCPPKQQLELLQRHMQKPSRTLLQCYTNLAELVNIPTLRKSSQEFEKFYKNIKSAIENIS